MEFESAEEYLYTLYSQVLQNDLILEKILRAADFADILNSRLVSKFWNHSATLIISRIGTINFKDLKDWEIRTIWAKEFSAKIQVFQNVGMQNIRLSESAYQPFQKTSYLENFETQRFEILFHICNEKLQRLEINFASPQLKLLFEKCSKIKKVTLGADISEISIKIPTSASTRLLKVSFAQYNYEQFPRIFPNLQEIQIHSHYAKSFLKFAAMETTEVIFPHLRILKIKGGVFWLDDKTQIPGKLEELEISKLELNESTAEALPKTVSKFSKSLKKLRLEFEPYHYRDPLVMLPKMERLEKLQIAVENNEHKNWEVGFEVGFCSFPNLEMLQIVEKEDCDFARCLLAEKNYKQFPRLEVAYSYFGNQTQKIFIN